MANLHLNELIRLAELGALREQRHMDEMKRLIIRHYRKIGLEQTAAELRKALNHPHKASSRARVNLILKALDHAVAELGLPPQRAEAIIKRAVYDRIQTLDEMMRLQNPQLSFNDPSEVQARAVAVARRQMNSYWAKEQRRFRNDVSRTIREAIRTKQAPEQAADLLEERLGVNRNRAVLIATDQMLTAAANADRRRQEAMGVKKYVWRTVGDKRVRDEHKLRNGKKYLWSKRADYPGKAIRCRCRALPVVEID